MIMLFSSDTGSWVMYGDVLSKKNVAEGWRWKLWLTYCVMMLASWLSMSIVSKAEESENG